MNAPAASVPSVSRWQRGMIWARRSALVLPVVRNTRMREAGMLTGLMLIIWFLWGSFLLTPLKILVVFFHEYSHALAAWASGGQVVQIQITAQQGGLCISQGGNALAILSAGYLGSLFWGGVLLVLSRWRGMEKNLAALLGILVLTVAFQFVRPYTGSGFLFSIATGIAITLCAINLPPFVNGLLLRIVGLTSCFYALLDIGHDTLTHPPLHSDAVLLREATGVPAFVWGLLWLGIALPSVYFFLRMATHRPGTLFRRRAKKATSTSGAASSTPAKQ